MPGIAVRGLDSAGGSQLGGGQDFFLVEGQPVIVRGDPVSGHGNSPHGSPSMVGASDWMFLDGVPVCRQGDSASCGHSSSGRSWFLVD